MEGKLYKSPNGEHYYLTVNNQIFADVDGHPLKSINQVLSLKNCQAIENGYDLEELAYGCDLYEKMNFVGQMSAFKLGFQKALEILGDKKFSEGDMRRALSAGLSIGYGRQFEIENKQIEIENYIQSLQQTEWDVEIETEEVIIGQCNCECHSNTRILHFMPCCNPKIVTNPKLDTNGCLILKKI
jgi:hypothetical protein